MPAVLTSDLISGVLAAGESLMIQVEAKVVARDRGDRWVCHQCLISCAIGIHDCPCAPNCQHALMDIVQSSGDFSLTPWVASPEP
jgi:hypothetical protein